MKNLYFDFIIAYLIRIAVHHSSFKSAIEDRVEVSTPLNSWKKLKEGIFLYDSGVDPYTGDVFHETPLMLYLFRTLIPKFEPYLMYIFSAIDLLTALILYKMAAKFVPQMKGHEDSYRREEVIRQTTKEIANINVEETPLFVAYAYLYNPFIVLNCVGQTTTVISNLCLASLLYFLVKGCKYSCVCLIALAALQSCYPLLLIVPVCLYFFNPSQPFRSILTIVLGFSLMLGFLLGLSFTIAGNWRFLESIYWFTFNVEDLTPNIGLFWYFFTEMFEHFRSLFIAALQINATLLYLFPLSLHLRDEPVFLMHILMALTTVFKSYPCLGDVGFYLALLPLWNHLFSFMQQLFIIGCILVITCVLGPTVWHLWIYAGSANANFFFGTTLAFATAQIFLITDLLFAHKKRKFAVQNGWPTDTSKSILVLE